MAVTLKPTRFAFSRSRFHCPFISLLELPFYKVMVSDRYFLTNLGLSSRSLFNPSASTNHFSAHLSFTMTSVLYLQMTWNHPALTEAVQQRCCSQAKKAFFKQKPFGSLGVYIGLLMKRISYNTGQPKNVDSTENEVNHCHIYSQKFSFHLCLIQTYIRLTSDHI